MTWKEKLHKKINEYIFWICLCLAVDGTIILIDTAITNGYCPPYTIVSYMLWCLQRYSILFIPLLLYVGYKFKDKISSIRLNLISVAVFISIISIIETISFYMFYYVINTNYLQFYGISNTSTPYAPYLSINFQVLYWGILMITTFCIFLKSKFSIFFSFALCYFMFYLADILFEFPKTAQWLFNSSWQIWEPDWSTLFLLFSCLILLMYKLNVRLKRKDIVILICTFIPLLFSWIYYYSIWGIVDDTIFITKIPAIEPFDRIFAFPFIIVISLYMYKSSLYPKVHRVKSSKSLYHSKR
jgi:hypothetical protein